MDIVEVRKTVAQIILDASENSIRPSSYDEELHMDSLVLLELLIALEKRFGVVVDESDPELLEKFNSVNQIARFVLNTEAG
ncbi:phosphopantetheine-binding protein [Haliea sp. E17]|uniref:phosphopantetheine-binding protein n=1 Tax=Haliea sp. E17 TaxID=3401576 RepID=UPI003AAC267D